MRNGGGVFWMCATASGELFWQKQSCSTTSSYFRLSILTRGGKAGMGGMALLLLAEAMVRGYFDCVLRVIYRSTYVEIVF